MYHHIRTLHQSSTHTRTALIGYNLQYNKPHPIDKTVLLDPIPNPSLSLSRQPVPPPHKRRPSLPLLLLHLPHRSLPITPRNNQLHTLIRHFPHPMTRAVLRLYIPRFYRLSRRRHYKLQTILSGLYVAECVGCARADGGW